MGLQIFIKFNNKLQIYNLSKVSYKNIKSDILNKFGITKYHENYVIIHNNNILNSSNINKIKDNDILNLNIKIKGGIFDLLLDTLLSIYDFILKLGGLVEDLTNLFVNVMEMVPVVFDPNRLIDDVIFGVIEGISQIFSALIEKLDFSQSEADQTDSGGPFGVTEKKQAICMPPSFINLLILVLCPPLALFLYKGWTAFFLIVICALMTYYLYYFPGFIFAALYILC
jgi:uncharacterized membrane protein YqaE (UPF0057 family)